LSFARSHVPLPGGTPQGNHGEEKNDGDAKDTVDAEQKQLDLDVSFFVDTGIWVVFAAATAGAEAVHGLLGSYENDKPKASRNDGDEN